MKLVKINKKVPNLSKYRSALGGFLSLLICLSITPLFSQKKPITPELDVLSYQLSLQPDILSKSIEGSVHIKFLTQPEIQQVVFSCGNLRIKEVKGATMKAFEQKGKKLTLILSEERKTAHEVSISYSGSPKKGLVFLSEPAEMYTVYFSSEWMPCHESPADKAKIKMDLIVPKGFTALASGTLASITEARDLCTYSFDQNYATPAYTYGFSIGTFQQFHEKEAKTSLNYYSHHHSPAELATIFGKTGDMLSFFEEKAGIPYPQKSYSQILIGNHYQEMSGLSVLKQSYGALVLADSTETNLISHELAHQWWGNLITCESWKHFWLNEGFATFMSAAYNEHRFGKDKYQENINAYKGVYLKIKEKGADKSLVFPNWNNPSGDDRNLVYFKGAYVFHVLKEELGEAAFWEGIKYYTHLYYGKSVNTQNFQDAMEASTGRDLSAFFDTWIY